MSDERDEQIYAFFSIRFDMSRDVFEAHLADRLKHLAGTILDQFDELHAEVDDE